jgi:CBS domain-containing protein
MKYGVNVREFMTTNPVIILPNENIKSAAELMISRGVGSLIVIDEDKLVGIITEKDMVEKIIKPNKSVDKLRVKDIMTENVITISPDMDLQTAVELMNDKNVRRLPVVDDEKLVGLITEKDVLKIEPSVIGILMEKAHIMGGEIKSISGKCDVCGNKADSLLKKDSMRVCESCT